MNNGWRIANTPGDSPPSTDVVSQFLSAYVPLVRSPLPIVIRMRTRRAKGRGYGICIGQPFFVLLTFGYKLIKQTEMIPLEKMTFYQGQLPPFNPEDNEPKGWLEKLLAWLLLI